MRYSCALILAALIYFFQTLLFWPPEVSTESLVPRRTAVAGDLVLEILILMDFTTTPLARSHQILGSRMRFRDPGWIPMKYFFEESHGAYLVVNMPLRMYNFPYICIYIYIYPPLKFNIDA